MAEATSLFRGPNLLTLLRMVAALPIGVLLLVAEPAAQWSAFALYASACVTDWIDGYWARRSDRISVIGTVLDPIADKLLVAVVLVGLLANDTISGWHALAPALIFLREFLVAGLREGLAGDGFTLPVSFFGKAKTSVQMIALGLLIAAPVSGGDLLLFIGLVLLWLATLMTVWSGLSYLTAAVGFMSRPERS